LNVYKLYCLLTDSATNCQIIWSGHISIQIIQACIESWAKEFSVNYLQDCTSPSQNNSHIFTRFRKGESSIRTIRHSIQLWFGWNSLMSLINMQLIRIINRFEVVYTSRHTTPPKHYNVEYLYSGTTQRNKMHKSAGRQSLELAGCNDSQTSVYFLI
jgi:hypothetical protein